MGTTRLPLDDMPTAAPRPGLGRALAAALEGGGMALPVSIAAVVWLAAKIGPDYVAPLLWASLLGLAVVNFAGSFSGRPLVFSVRFFSVSILAGALDTFAARMPYWGLADTPQVRATLMAAVCIAAALCQPVLYLLRAQRLARFIPGPVFAGFTNATAVLVVAGQVPVLEALVLQHGMRPSAMLVLMAACIGAAALARALLPGLPASLAGLVVASLLGLLLAKTGGLAVPMVLAHNLPALPHLPAFDWQAWLAPQAATLLIARDVLFAGMLLGAAVFMSTALAQALVDHQSDERPAPTLRQNLALGAAQAVAAMLGALPLGAASSATLGAARVGALGPLALRLLALAVLAFCLTGWLAWIPLAAVAALLLFEAWSMVDRASLAPLARFVGGTRAGSRMNALEREDTFTWLLVVAAALAANMLVAVPVGIMAGLVLFARRNGRAPVRDVRQGAACRSNCARSRRAMAWLDSYGGCIRCVRLQGALFFGSANLLYEQLQAALPGARFVVLDWESVISVDTTIGGTVARFEARARAQGVRVVHAAFAARRLLLGLDAEQAPELTADDGLDGERYFADADRALEFVENRLLEMPGGRPAPADERAWMEDTAALLRGFDAAQCQRVEACFTQRAFGVGTVLFAEGENTRELYMLRRGSVNILVGRGRLRVASVRAGATLGEMGFLDGTPRSATAVVAEDAVAGVLSRRAFDTLAREEPALAFRLMENLGVELSARLRSTNVQLTRSRN
ncbi:cyclic nucleotide-binding domain-containing protein [Ramlibacter sp. H39-3-26]|uniref:cyclic nucleotide-binding domain-containing protein n=1 Tax=Curvibacter soli TaxID=3031331 RepID=UPI0023DB2623|nr:cyclic nucleotide-binding domain-containing protein [Ramlibacter sp. H39-3-26]MDF1484280.1 cyclic nucleotide-binding domain-containing protein [Ramlibacter sp. H39-3-26]